MSQVAWLRSDEDLATLISVQTTVLSNDPRFRVLSSNNNQKWTLQIKEVTESDAGLELSFRTSSKELSSLT